MNQTKTTIMDLITNQTITKAIDSVIQPLSLFNVGTWLEQYTNYLKKRLDLGMLKLKQFECLFTLDTCSDMITAYLNDEIGNLLTNSFCEKLMISESFTSDDIGVSNQFLENVQNYQGFDLTNQDGQFLKTTTGNKQSGGVNKLTYISYIQQYTNRFVEKVINWIKSNICILIY